MKIHALVVTLYVLASLWIVLLAVSLSGQSQQRRPSIVKSFLDSFSTTQRQWKHLKFDEAAPRAIPGTTRSYLFPNAVPLRRTIPSSQAENETYHIAKRKNTTTQSITGRKRQRPQLDGAGRFNWHHNYSLDNRALYLYNPSILPLYPPGNSENPVGSGQMDKMSKEDYQVLTGGDKNVHYLASFRANTGGNCFGSDHTKLMQTGDQISYLVLALLDEELNPILDTDTLIDMNAGPLNGKYFRQLEEDCRLDLLKGSIYLFCNDRAFKMRIRRRRHPATRVKLFGEKDPLGTVYSGEDLTLPYRHPPIYGDGLDVVQLAQTYLPGGKNFNVFRASEADKMGGSDSRQTSYFLQTLPLPHRYRRLVFKSGNRQSWLKQQLHVEEEQGSTKQLPKPTFSGPDTSRTIATCSGTNETKSAVLNCATPIISPFFRDHDHGTSCCISLSLREGKIQRPVLVGISHTKTKGYNPWWTKDMYGRYNDGSIGHKRYLSRLVAYNPSPPFDIVARSGWFCLGFGDNKSMEKSGNTLAGRNRRFRLDLFNETFDCPMVHFPSSITEVVNDHTRAIISYGVLDCYPVSIMVEKSEIARLLTP